jgi:hypothetical protein
VVCATSSGVTVAVDVGVGVASVPPVGLVESAPDDELLVELDDPGSDDEAPGPLVGVAPLVGDTVPAGPPEVDVAVGVDEPPVAGATHAGSFWTMARIRRS